MDPNNQNPQGGNDAVNKLEQDLQNLKQETPATPQQPVPVVEPLQPLPQVPEETPAPPVPSVPLPSAVEANASTLDVPKKGSPLMIIAIILALVAVLAVIAYVFGAKLLTPQSTPTPIALKTPSPTPDVTANWKILNNKYGFSLKYPNSLSVLGVGIQVDETNAPDVIISSKSGNPQDNTPALHINVSPKTSTVFKDMTLSQISQANYDANQANKNTFKQVIAPLKTTTLDGKPAYTYTILANGFSGKWSSWPVNASVSNIEKLTIVESENNGNYFILVYSADDPTLAVILSTFKFTEVTPSGSPTASTISTANWKTYTNSDLSFKYPTEWKEGTAVGSIVANVDGAGINAFTKDMPMYNECMKVDKTDIVDGKMVKYYSYAYSTEACSNQGNIGNYEVWITKAGGDGYQPGIIYSYNTTAFPNSFNIFKQILTTFKFTN